MFEYRKNSAVQINSKGSSAAAGPGVCKAKTRLLPLLRRGLLTVAVAGAVGGCAQVQYGSMFSDDRQLQQQASLQPSLTISKDIDLVRVNGVVGSAVEAAMIRLRVASIYGAEMLIDDLQIDGRLNEAEWYTAVLDTAEDMQDVEKFAITAENGQLRLDGEMESQASAEALASNASLALGELLVVSNEINFPGREASQEAISTATLLPLENTAVPSAEQQARADQELSAQSIPAPGVSGTIPMPVTSSAVVLEQRTALNDNSDSDLFVPPADDGIVRSASNDLTNDSDGDGVPNSIDECKSRPGYPVNARGCQALDGMLKNVGFQGESGQLTPEAMESLNNVARVMKEYPAARIAILSYTSNFGSALETRGQSRERARSVVGYLINKGVEGARLEAYAFGHINNSDDHIKIKEVD